jgi:hypothetical protein
MENTTDTPTTPAGDESGDRSIAYWLRAVGIGMAHEFRHAAHEGDERSWREIADDVTATLSDAVSPEDYETTRASLEAMARRLGWDEDATRGFGDRGFGPFGRKGFGPRHGFGPRGGFGPGFGGFGPGAPWGGHGHAGHGHGEHGHGGHGHHGRGKGRERAYERGFEAGFSAGRGERPSDAA